ncbi:MAG: hypothetical protein RID53_15695 [Coleofasciculus sp. B1-GNL1-01]|uniref:hypothetical protein n=1 Tax=Coleofasciculus sp. B1-GNL1-01 TaxID=3068484 RepID=UPI003302BFEB
MKWITIFIVKPNFISHVVQRLYPLAITPNFTVFLMTVGSAIALFHSSARMLSTVGV